jgi:hypothetical protein
MDEQLIFARAAQAALRSLPVCRSKGLNPSNAHKVQVACIQAVALYGSEVWWKGQKNRIDDLQRMVNQQARDITGCLHTTPLGPLLKEAGLRPAESLLENRQRRYGARLLTLPEGHLARTILPGSARGSPPRDGEDGEERWSDPFTRNDLLGEQLAWMAGGNGVMEPGVGIEKIQVVLEREELQAKVTIPPRAEAITACNGWNDTESWPIYSDGSRNEAGHVGTGVAWKARGQWMTRKTYLGMNKGIVDAELYGIAEATRIARKRSRREGFKRATVFVDAQGALPRIQNNTAWSVSQSIQAEGPTWLA